MEGREILRCIDKGANRYVHLFGQAEHMEIAETKYYKVVRPKEGMHGIRFVYDIDLDGVPEDVRKEQIAQIKALGMPWWLDLCASDALFEAFFGKKRVHGQQVSAEEDEVYMAMLPEEMPDWEESGQRICRVRTEEEFAIWAKIANDVLAGGRPDLHPTLHWPLCARGRMACYTAYDEEGAAAVAAVIEHEGIASLEFVATLPEKRRRGHAAAVCAGAVRKAFEGGASIVTVRAINVAAAKLYASLGFKAYNHLI